MTIRRCPVCRRRWAPLDSEDPETRQCPTCRQGQPPLSTAHDGKQQPKASEPEA